MASAFLRPVLRPWPLGSTLGLSIACHHALTQRPSRLDTGALAPDLSPRPSAPAVQHRFLTPGAARQISSGSILGLGAGLAVSTFSRSLALLIGLLVVGVQVGDTLQSVADKAWATNHGINVIPYHRLQKYVTSGIDLRSLVRNNAVFKISFGTTFALAAFMHF